MPEAKVSPGAASTRLRLTEIFCSIQGESSRVGLPTVFVRLTGCPLRCRWCDTEYAFNGGKYWSIEETLAEVARHGVPTVCVTGGEPLAQKGCLALLGALCDAGYSVSLETSGALDIAAVDPRVSRVMDLKAPGSAEASRNRWENIPCSAPPTKSDRARQQVRLRLGRRTTGHAPPRGALPGAALAGAG